MKYKPTTKQELKVLVNDLSIDLGDIDTSLITDMSYLFNSTDRKDFSGIEAWDVSNVTNMSGMFFKAKKFNQPLNDWDVSSVIYMGGMFYGAKKFNQPLDKWDLSKVLEKRQMFFDYS